MLNRFAKVRCCKIVCVLCIFVANQDPIFDVFWGYPLVGLMVLRNYIRRHIPNTYVHITIFNGESDYRFYMAAALAWAASEMEEKLMHTSSDVFLPSN